MTSTTIQEINSRIEQLQEVSTTDASLANDLINSLIETKNFLGSYDQTRQQFPALRLLKTPTLAQRLMSLELQNKRQLVVAIGTGMGKSFGSIESAVINGAKNIFLTCPPSLCLQWAEKIHDDFNAHVVLMSSDPIQNIDPNQHGNILKSQGIWLNNKEVLNGYGSEVPTNSLDELLNSDDLSIVIVPISYISTAGLAETETLKHIMSWSDCSIRDESHMISSSAKSDLVESDEVDDFEDEVTASNRHMLMRSLTSDKVKTDPDYLCLALTATPCPTGEIQKVTNLISMTTGKEPLRSGFGSRWDLQKSDDLTWAASYVHRHCFVIPSHIHYPTGFDPELQPQFRVSDTWHEDYDGLHILNLTKQEMNELARVSNLSVGCGYDAVTTEDKILWTEQNLLQDNVNTVLFFDQVDAEGKGALKRLQQSIDESFASDSTDEELIINILGRNLQDTLNGKTLSSPTALQMFLDNNTKEPTIVETNVPPAQTGPKNASEIIGKAYSLLKERGYDVRSYRLGNLMTEQGTMVESVRSMEEMEAWVKEGGKKVLLASRKISTGTDGLQNLFRKLVVMNLPHNPSEVEQLVGRIFRNRSKDCEFWGEPVEIHYVLKDGAYGPDGITVIYDNDIKSLSKLVEKARMITQIVEGIDPSDSSDVNLDDAVDRFERKYSSDDAVLCSVTSESAHENISTI